MNRRCDDTLLYSGVHSRERFYEDLLTTSKLTGCEIQAIFPSQEVLANALGVTNHAKLSRLERLAAQTSVKCLLSQTNLSPVFIPCFEFRALTNYQGFSYPAFTYHDKTVIVIPQNGSDFAFAVVRSMDAAVRDRKNFEHLWNAAIPLGVQEAPERSHASV